jgi:uncharacterized OsmC-like protein
LLACFSESLNSGSQSCISQVGDLSEQFVTKLRQTQGYKFKVAFDEGIPELLVDERKPTGEDAGPNPARMLSAAVGHCLSSSLLFCLQKARIEAKSIETTVKTTTERNPEGRLRVKGIQVQISLRVDEKNKERLPRCLEIFENFCTVTQSVRRGIPVGVSVDTQ